MHARVLLCKYKHAKFEGPSFTAFKDMIGSKIKNGSRDHDPAHQGVCHPKARTRCTLPAYKIWRLSLQPFRRYNCGRQN